MTVSCEVTLFVTLEIWTLALLIALFRHGDLSAKLQQIAMLFLLQSFHTQQPGNFEQLFLE